MDATTNIKLCNGHSRTHIRYGMEGDHITNYLPFTECRFGLKAHMEHPNSIKSYNRRFFLYKPRNDYNPCTSIKRLTIILTITYTHGLIMRSHGQSNRQNG